MRSLKRLTIATVLVLIPLWGCDGRGGSSGLDVSNENAVIGQALSKRQCLGFQALTICPADEPATGTPSIDTTLGNATSIDCFQSIPGGSCTFVLRFTAQAFAANTTFKTLSRADASSNPWILGADPVLVSGGQASTYDATLVLTSPQGGPPAQVQLAILAFAGAPASSPNAVEELHQTAATFAFVTQVLAVNVLTPTPLPTPTRRPTGTPTPTATPGTNDCCQCPSSCAAPVGGACDSGCTVVFGTSCFGEHLCALRTVTPTLTPSLTPTPCLKDNGDGTITDGCTGLMWEKKDEAGGLHDYSASYPWAGECDREPQTLPKCQPDAASAAACAQATNGAVGCSQCAVGPCTLLSHGTMTIWGWLVQLNQGQGFAGYTDWRIPSVGKEGGTTELETIITPLYPDCSAPPCVAPIFNTNCPTERCNTDSPCGNGLSCATPGPDGVPPRCQTDPGCTVTNCSCTDTIYYWSAISDVSTPNQTVLLRAWGVTFGNGSVDSLPEVDNLPVRAVRGRVTPSPTSTPGANDCCQCTSSCAAPVDGTCDGCPVVTGAACDGGPSCSTHTPTPTPTPCLKDNGDGTVSDGCTRLMWEKKDQAGGLHDYGTLYTWAGVCAGNSSLCQPNAAAADACAGQTGGALGCGQCTSGTCIVDPDHGGAATTIWDWLSQLNTMGLAGYNDWRIPTVGREGGTAELETIEGPTSSSCSALPVFSTNCISSTVGCSVTTCSCTATSYWAATTYLAQPGSAEEQDFHNCGGGAGPKTNELSVRAVRGGL
jgi:hypothetical protein